MPHFTEPDVVRLYLPSTEGNEEKDRIWVDVRNKVRLGDMINGAGLGTLPVAVGAIAAIIVDWNLYLDDADTIKMPITAEYVNKIELKDYYFLTNWLDEQTEKQKDGASKEENLVSTASSPEAETSTEKTSPPISTTTG
jgi:tetrahydromethanopterin S-methyltransferase subunit A